jgi:transposase
MEMEKYEAGYYSDIIGNITIKPRQHKKCDVEGEGAVNERTAQRWFKRFVSGNLGLEDEQRPGRPRIWDSEATKEAAEQQPSTSMLRLSDLALQRVLFIATQRL